MWFQTKGTANGLLLVKNKKDNANTTSTVLCTESHLKKYETRTRVRTLFMNFKFTKPLNF